MNNKTKFVIDPVPGTRVKVRSDMVNIEGKKSGKVLSFLGMLIKVQWDDGTISEVNSFFIEEE